MRYFVTYVDDDGSEHDLRVVYEASELGAAYRRMKMLESSFTFAEVSGWRPANSRHPFMVYAAGVKLYVNAEGVRLTDVDRGEEGGMRCDYEPDEGPLAGECLSVSFDVEPGRAAVNRFYADDSDAGYGPEATIHYVMLNRRLLRWEEYEMYHDQILDACFRHAHWLSMQED